MGLIAVTIMSGVLIGYLLSNDYKQRKRIAALELDVDRLAGGQRHLMLKAGIEPKTWLWWPRDRSERN